MSSIPTTTFVVFGHFLVEKWAKLPNLAVICYLIWLRFVTQFGCVLLPSLAGKQQKVGIGVRNLIKKHRFRTPIATFCCLPAKLGSETQPNWVPNHGQIR